MVEQLKFASWYVIVLEDGHGILSTNIGFPHFQRLEQMLVETHEEEMRHRKMLLCLEDTETKYHFG